MSPGELIPYIEARDKWRNREMRIENERIGLICATLANVFRDTKKHPAPYVPADFVQLDATPPKPAKSTPQQIYDKMKMICGMFAAGGRHRV